MFTSSRKRRRNNWLVVNTVTDEVLFKCHKAKEADRWIATWQKEHPGAQGVTLEAMIRLRGFEFKRLQQKRGVCSAACAPVPQAA